MTKIKWTGERLERSIINETMFEHLHRYALATEFANNKIVLDIACGEGYGSNLLSKEASKVIGVDINKNVIAQAKNKYNKSNLTFIEGSIYSIPCENKSIDLLTCFETIEHVSDHYKVINEIKRVLKPNGILIISTPDKFNYSEKREYQNRFHIKELYFNEFNKLITNHFKFNFFLIQRYITASFVSPCDTSSFTNYYEGNYDVIHKNKPEPMYWIGIASDIEFELPGTSIFYDLKTVTDHLKEQEHIFKNTFTYKLAHFLLTPLKILRQLVNK